MPFQPDHQFTRQAVANKEHVRLLIPANARPDPGLPGHIATVLPSPPSEPPEKFSFHYVDYPVEPALLEDSKIIRTGIYEFDVKDGVIGAYLFPFDGYNDQYWSFVSTQETVVVAALKIGSTLDIAFDQPFERVFHINKSHFSPPDTPVPDYGKYELHVTIDSLTATGFRIVSSYEPGSELADTRLPLFFGFRVYGRASQSPQLPFWREALGQALLGAISQRWHEAVINSAIAIESFLSQSTDRTLTNTGIGENFIREIIDRMRWPSLPHALSQDRGFDKKKTDNAVQSIGESIFKRRNDLMHGHVLAHAITSADAETAIRAVVEFIWDWDPQSRDLLLMKMRPFDEKSLIDAELIAAAAESS